MRDIKFRAWLDCGDGSGEMLPNIQNHINGKWAFGHIVNGSVDNVSEPMQYTGLKDKNGVEIYEGDLFNTTILARHPTDRWGGEYWVKVTAKVDFINGRFVGVVVGHTKSSYEPEYKRGHFVGKIAEIRDIEVIGNINENPELVG